MVVVAIIGILAAVAIPAFLKNARKAKTTEAVINLKKLSDGAVAYFNGEYNKAGSTTVIAKQFPDTPTVNPVAPVAGACCQAGGITKCNPDATLWKDPSRQALAFSMDDPHYYSYSYKRAGNGGSGATAATLPDGSTPTEYFWADAYGDLNCDGVFSTFEMYGAIDKLGGVTTGAGLFKSAELE